MALSDTPISFATWDVGFSQISFSSASAEGQAILAGRGGGGFRLGAIAVFAGSGFGRTGDDGGAGGE